MPVIARHDEGCRAFGVGLVGIRTALHEELCDMRAPVLARNVERSEAVLVDAVHIGTLLQKQACHF